jgi:hypothetical protein
MQGTVEDDTAGVLEVMSIFCDLSRQNHNVKSRRPHEANYIH